MRYRLVAVIGPGTADRAIDLLAEEVGRRIGSSGVSMVTGGLGGVMASAARGFQAGAKSLPPERRGVVVGVLPGTDHAAANPDVDVILPSGLGEARNYLVVVAAAAVIAVGRGHGTLSEIGYPCSSAQRIDDDHDEASDRRWQSSGRRQGGRH